MKNLIEQRFTQTEQPPLYPGQRNPAHALCKVGLKLLCCVCILVAALNTALGHQDRSSVPQMRQAIAAQDVVIQQALTRQRSASIAAEQSGMALQAAELSLEQGVIAETSGDPVLRGLEQHLRAGELSSELTTELASLRENLSTAQTTLNRLRRENEAKKAAGLAVNEEQTEFLRMAVGLMRGRISVLDRIMTARERLRQVRERTFAAVRDFRAKVSALKLTEDAVRTARRERQRLFFIMGTRFEPRYLRMVTASTAGGREVYRATITPTPEWAALERNIEVLLAGLDGAQASLVEKRQAFIDAENRFIDVSQKWQLAHSKYQDNIQYSYYLHIGTEIADSLIGAISGRFNPAGIAFELGWRVGEIFLKDYRIEEPGISDALALYRSNLAQKLEAVVAQPSGVDLRTDEQWLEENRAQLLRQSLVFVPELTSLKQHVKSEQGLEFVKATADTGVTALLTRFAEQVSLRNQNASRALTAYLDSHMFAENLRYRALKFDKAEDWIRERARRFLGSGDAAGEVLEQTKGQWLKGKGKDLLLGAAVTAGQAAVGSVQRQRMAKLATEIALLDIEWLLRRHEYAMRGAEYRAFGARLVETEAAIGTILETASSAGRRRILTVSKNLPIATTDGVRLHLEFSNPVESAVVLIGGKQYGKVANADGTVDITLPADTFEPGPAKLAVTAVGKDIRFGLDFDADPTTVASYDPSPAARLQMRGLEGGSDEKHRLSFSASDDRPAAGPVAKVTVTPGKGIPAGKGRLVLIARDALGKSVRPPVTVNFGKTEVEYINPNFNEPMTLDVKPGVYNLIFHYWAAPLEKNGVTVTVGKVTTVDVGGYGRLQMTVLNAEGKPTRPAITIYQGGKEVEHINPNFNEPMTIDLPPGLYDLVFHIGEGIERKGISVQRGKVTPIVLRSQ